MELTNHKAILHIDADAFFASCEQALHPEYKGKPVITGKERGIVAAASYEAKALGIDRGTPLWKVKTICPDAIIVPSDYESYSLFSKRMFAIVNRYTPTVEEYSIDEAFADITGLQRPLKKSYPQIALEIKQAVEQELGITVSVGLSVNKVLAKAASKWDKPNGFTTITTGCLKERLNKLAIKKVWGIGPQTAAYLEKEGILTALDFAEKPLSWVKKRLTKPHLEIWQELNGETVYPILTTTKDTYQSISKFRTFTPPQQEFAFVFSQLSKNLENAFIKARRHKLLAQKIIIFLRDSNFHHFALEGSLNRATAYPSEVLHLLKDMFEQIHNPNLAYRATGVVITKLTSNNTLQCSLFEDPLQLEHTQKLHESIDELAARYGKHTLFYATSLLANKEKQHLAERGELPTNQQARQQQAHKRKFLDLPTLVGAVN